MARSQLAQIRDHGAQRGKIAAIAMQHRFVDVGMRDAAGMTGLLRPAPRFGHRADRACRLADEPQRQTAVRQPADLGVMPAEQCGIRFVLAGLIEREPGIDRRNAAFMTAEIEVDRPDAVPGLQLHFGILDILEIAEHGLGALAVHDGVR